MKLNWSLFEESLNETSGGNSKVANWARPNETQSETSFSQGSNRGGGVGGAGRMGRGGGRDDFFMLFIYF